MTGRTVIFDVETGGLDPQRHPIIQFAAIAVDEQWREIDAVEIKARFDPATAEAEALKLNGYDAEVWKRDGYEPKYACGLIADFLRMHASLGRVAKGSGKPYQIARLCGHNARFDSDFLIAWFKRSGGGFLPAACYEALDTLHLARWVSLFAPTPPADHKLGTLCAWLGIPLDNAHDALADVRATAELARRLTAKLFTPAPAAAGVGAAP